MTKEEARKQMSRMRRDMTPQERSRQNESIRRQILADPVWKEVSWFYPFVSYGTEVDTTGLIREVLAHPVQGRRINVAVPRVNGKDMEFYQIRSMEELCPGYQGILEPALHWSAGRSERRSDASAGACF